MKKSIVLDEEQLARLGKSSLIGMLMEPGLKEIELIFLQTSLGWKKQNGGPQEWIIVEYNIPCLIEDVLWFREHGVKVTITWKEV